MKTEKLKEFIKENELEKKYNLSCEKLIEYVVSNLELLSLLVANDSSKVEKERDNEIIERVVKHEIETKYGIQYMQNFSTFLNRFPDPQTIFDDTTNKETTTQTLLGNEYK